MRPKDIKTKLEDFSHPIKKFHNWQNGFPFWKKLKRTLKSIFSSIFIYFKFNSVPIISLLRLNYENRFKQFFKREFILIQSFCVNNKMGRDSKTKIFPFLQKKKHNKQTKTETTTKKNWTLFLLLLNYQQAQKFLLWFSLWNNWSKINWMSIWLVIHITDHHIDLFRNSYFLFN